MRATYLEEDVRLIQKYFPGARAVALHTPFDLTDRPVRGSFRPDTFRDTGETDTGLIGDLVWTH